MGILVYVSHVEGTFTALIYSKLCFLFSDVSFFEFNSALFIDSSTFVYKQITFLFLGICHETGICYKDVLAALKSLHLVNGECTGYVAYL